MSMLLTNCRIIQETGILEGYAIQIENERISKHAKRQDILPQNFANTSTSPSQTFVSPAGIMVEVPLRIITISVPPGIVIS